MKKRVTTNKDRSKGKVLSTMLALGILYSSQNQDDNHIPKRKGNTSGKFKKKTRVVTGRNAIPNKKLKKYRKRRLCGISGISGTGKRKDDRKLVL
jgi:hypothetical protein